MPASTAAAAGCADIRNSLRSAGSSSRPGASPAEGLTSQQKHALRNWCRAAAASAAQAWREFRPGSGLLYLEANVRLLPVEFQDAFGLAAPGGGRSAGLSDRGPRCWQLFKRLSTGTSMWCRPETACPVHILLLLLVSRSSRRCVFLDQVPPSPTRSFAAHASFAGPGSTSLACSRRHADLRAAGPFDVSDTDCSADSEGAAER